MKGLLLNIIAFILLFICYPFGYLFTIISNFSKAGRYSEDIAISLDILGNVVMAKLFNKIFIKGYQFGIRNETISSVLGKNLVAGTLTKTGEILVNILDKIDRNHCVKSIK